MKCPKCKKKIEVLKYFCSTLGNYMLPDDGDDIESGDHEEIDSEDATYQCPECNKIIELEDIIVEVEE